MKLEKLMDRVEYNTNITVCYNKEVLYEGKEYLMPEYLMQVRVRTFKCSGDNHLTIQI